jgi:hypothetical protein
MAPANPVRMCHGLCVGFVLHKAGNGPLVLARPVNGRVRATFVSLLIEMFSL